MSATETIAGWVAGTSYEDIPRDAVKAAKETVFDCLGLILAGSVESLGRIIQEHVREQGGPSESTVLGSGLETTPANAALANATMGMALDYDPEPQMMAIAAGVLAVAEKTGASGRDLIEAFVIGAELGWMIGETAVIDMERRGLHHHGVLGGIAVAAACAKLAKLEQPRIKMALGLAGSMGGGLLQSEGSMTKPLLGGLSARDGVMAAQLAAKGMTSGEQLFDHPSGFCGTPIAEGVYDLHEKANRLGQPFLIQQFKYVRQYPCCRANHGVLDSLLGLMRDEQFTYEDVRSVEIDQSYQSIVVRFDRPENEHQARFSIRYNIAAALVDGKIGPASFTPERVTDPLVHAAMDKVHINIQTQWEVGAGDWNIAVPVKVNLEDGRSVMRATEPDQILGSYRNPLGLEHLLGKFRENANLALPGDQVEQALDLWSPEGEVKIVSEAIHALAVCRTSKNFEA